jgi:plasmid stabilization system protein ParE
MPATPLPLIWSPRAQQDLRRLRRWIAAQAPRTETAYVADLIAKTATLSQHPRRGHPLHEAQEPDVGAEPLYREIHSKNHRIIYSLEPDAIRIEIVVHQLRAFDLSMLDP